MSAIPVLLDARKLGDGGIGTYLENLVDGFLELNELHGERIALTLLVSPGDAAKRHQALFERWQRSVRMVEEPAPKYSFAEYFLLARRHRALCASVDLFHSPHYTLPFALPIPAVVTIHDIIHVTYPDSPLHRPTARMLIASAIRRSRRVITVSEHSARQIRQNFRVAPGMLSAIPNAVSTGISRTEQSTITEVCARYGVKGEYLVFVGSDRPHKGYRMLQECWSLLQQKRATTPTLVVIGDRFDEATKRLGRDLRIADAVHYLGAVSRRDLSALLSGARALLVPSLEEGFCLPALEAFACETAVVSTPIPAIAELGGDLVRFADGFDAPAFADAVAAVLAIPLTDRFRVGAGERAARFSRLAVAQATFDVYRSVLGAAVGGADGEVPERLTTTRESLEAVS
ncbi:MAG: glycosyltransferase family 4 protein [Bdellovibrionales bacterium]|nr:glycosyltransferase family 4 protein [Bdellovibrionales bacterium]